MMVLAEVTQDWQRALARAEARNIQATQIGSTGRAGSTITYYRVSSWSRPETQHGVKVTVDASGVQVVCSCKGGLNERPCQHAAAALKAAGWLGDWLTAAVTPEEIARLKGRRSLALLNDDETEYDRLTAELGVA
jgi:hypothetical protein